LFVETKNVKIVDKIGRENLQEWNLIKNSATLFFKDLVQLYQGFWFEFSEISGELKLLSFTQILSMAVKRLDFCQLLSEIFI
jgi:hypothetical protein